MSPRPSLRPRIGSALLVGFLGGTLGLSSTAGADAPDLPRVVINEVVASNATGLADQDGDNPDWIELYNADEEPVSLAGWTISDDEERPDRWTFEGGTLEPGEHYLLFASGKDLPYAEPPHTNFRIARDGEPLLLSDDEGNTVDALPPTEIPTDVSWGRQPDGADSFHYFAEPTPDVPNTAEPLAQDVWVVH